MGECLAELSLIFANFGSNNVLCLKVVKLKAVISHTKVLNKLKAALYKQNLNDTTFSA